MASPWGGRSSGEKSSRVSVPVNPGSIQVAENGASSWFGVGGNVERQPPECAAIGWLPEVRGTKGRSALTMMKGTIRRRAMALGLG